MQLLDSVQVRVEDGLEGDFRGSHPRRQVTVLALEAWHAVCAEVGAQLPWQTRRANLLVEGLLLQETRGQRLSIGDLELEITGETDPCYRMDEAMAGLKKALIPDWRGGVLCKVITPGRIEIGDSTVLHPSLNEEA